MPVQPVLLHIDRSPDPAPSPAIGKAVRFAAIAGATGRVLRAPPTARRLSH